MLFQAAGCVGILLAAIALLAWALIELWQPSSPGGVPPGTDSTFSQSDQADQDESSSPSRSRRARRRSVRRITVELRAAELKLQTMEDAARMDLQAETRAGWRTGIAAQKAQCAELRAELERAKR